jgi:hypothetical protein
MNTKELFLAALGGQPTEKPFLWESGVWDAAIRRWKLEGIPTGHDTYDYLGLQRIAGCTLSYQPDPEFLEQVVSDEAEFWLIETEAGDVYRKYKHEFIPGSPGNHLLAELTYPIRDRKSWNFVKKRMRSNTDTRLCISAGFENGSKEPLLEHSGLTASCDPADGFPTALSAIGPSYWYVRYVGFDSAAMWLYDHRSLVQEIFEHYTDFLLAQFKRIFSRRVPDIVFLGEGSAASTHGLFMSPDMYRELVIPHLKRLSDYCFASGVPFVCMTSGGNIEKLVPLWLDIGINCLDPLDSSTPLESLCREYPEMALIGGIDRRVLEQDSRTLETHIRERAGMMYRHGRSIPSCDAHFGITSAVSLDNMKLYVSLLQETWERENR